MDFVLINISISDVDENREDHLIKFTDGMKLGVGIGNKWITDKISLAAGMMN